LFQIPNASVITMNEIHIRCADGQGCREVIDRLVASDVARALGEHEHADRLRQSAARWAEAHNHGSASPRDSAEEQAS